jgi:MFS family permease
VSAVDQQLDIARLQRRTVRLLVCTQILSGVGIASGVAVATLTAAILSGSDLVGGLAQTAMVTGTALFALPAAQLASRAGRRPTLAMGFLTASLGALVAVLAIELRSWPLLLSGLVLFGAASMASLASRYASADMAPPAKRARQLSFVVWASTIGAVAGPNLAAPAQRATTEFGLSELTVPFLMAAVVFGLAAAVLWMGLRPDPLLVARGLAEHQGETPSAGSQHSSRAGVGRALAVLRRSPDSRFAVAGIGVCQVVMVALMAMTPVHLHHGHASLATVGVVMSSHLGAMYAFSPLVGMAVERFGARLMLACGCMVLAVATVVSGVAKPADATVSAAALVLLGVGWSLGLISSSTLLTRCTSVADRPSVQGASDLTMSVGSAVGGICAGVVVSNFSFVVLAMTCGLVLLLFAGYWIRLQQFQCHLGWILRRSHLVDCACQRCSRLRRTREVWRGHHGDT